MDYLATNKELDELLSKVYTLIGCLMGSGTPYEPVSPSVVDRLLGWSVCLS